MLASLRESRKIPFSKDRLISLSSSMLIALGNCFDSLVGNLLGARALPRLSVLITPSIYLGDVGSKMKVFFIGVVN